eukprot:SAG11_NODE_21912_length_416_cov_0.817035_1_plen_103_part_10
MDPFIFAFRHIYKSALDTLHIVLQMILPPFSLLAARDLKLCVTLLTIVAAQSECRVCSARAIIRANVWPPRALLKSWAALIDRLTLRSRSIYWVSKNTAGFFS